MIAIAKKNDTTYNTGSQSITAGKKYLVAHKKWLYYVACDDCKIRTYNQHHFDSIFDIIEQ